MLEIFIIKRIIYNSDAGEEGDILLGYVTSEEVAIKKVARLNMLHKEATVLSEKISEQLFNIIEPSIAPEEMEEYPQYPKWRPGIPQNEITEEMRAERDRIVQIQVEIRERHRQIESIRREKVEKLKQEYIDSLNISLDVLETMDAEQGCSEVLRYGYEKIEELI